MHIRTYETESTKNGSRTLNTIGKNNLNTFIFVPNNINSIRNKLDILASQVKGNANVIMISETKLDDTLPVDQFVLERFNKPFRNDHNKSGVASVFVCEDIPPRLISIEKAL